MNEITPVNQNKIISDIVLHGDISKLKPEEKTQYYDMLCKSLGLNPVTQPFKLITLQGKQVLYASKDCTEQLRKQQSVSVIEQTEKIMNDMYIVNVKLQDAKGRIDTGKGVVNIKGLYGDNLANAMMKAETKAKRRGTLSICGLGMLDETELETIPELKNNLNGNGNHKQDDMNTFQTDYEKLSEDIIKGFQLAGWPEQKIKAKCIWAKFDEKKLQAEIDKDLDKKTPFHNNDKNVPI